MPKIIIFMQGGVIDSVVADVPGIQVFKVEDDDGGDAAQGDEFRRLTWPGKEKYTDERWAYEVGRAGVAKRLIKKLVPQILSDETLVTWCRGCHKYIPLKEAVEVEKVKYCKACSAKKISEKGIGRTA